MTYINHREAHVSAEVHRIYDFIHRSCITQQELDRIIEESTNAKSLAGGRGAAVGASPESCGKAGPCTGATPAIAWTRSQSQDGPSVAPPTSIGVNAGLQRKTGAGRRIGSTGPRTKGA